LSGFDTKTLLVMSLLVSGLIGAFCRGTFSRDSESGLMHAWGTAVLMITAGTFLHMTRLVLPELIGVVIGNGLFFLSALTIDRAARRFGGDTGPDRLGWWLSGTVVAVLGILCIASPDLRPRGAIFSIVLGILLVRLAWRFEYRAPAGTSQASRFCARVLGLWAILYVLRAAYFAASPPWTNFFAADAVIALTFALSILMVIAVTLGFTWFEILARDRQLLALESRDTLTGLLNRASFLAELDAEAQRCARTGSGFVLLVMDIDNLGGVNERLGWARGDEMLRRAASQFEFAARWEDTTGRIGGDRFALLLRDADPGRALQRARVLCSALCEKLTDANRERQIVTVSGGLAACPGHGHESLDIVRYAEAALLIAKRTGNAVELAALPEGLAPVGVAAGA
jgi:diguanylate cyclase (GGDEF)-like protein